VRSFEIANDNSVFFLFTMKTQARVERSMLFEKSQSRCIGVSLKGNFRPRFLAPDPFFPTTFNDRAICICRVCENVPFWKKKTSERYRIFFAYAEWFMKRCGFFSFAICERERLLCSSRSEMRTASSQKRRVLAFMRTRVFTPWNNTGDLEFSGISFVSPEKSENSRGILLRISKNFFQSYLSINFILIL